MSLSDWCVESPWFSVTAPVTSGTLARSAGITDQVVAQFEVDTNPRYKKRDVSGTGRIDTMCNIFLADATKALGCEVQHLEMGPGGPREQDANAAIRWLMTVGIRHGWWKLPQESVIERANSGLVCVATFLNPGGIGHVAQVVPSYSVARVLISQAGERNFQREPVENGFGRYPVVYFCHQ